MNTFDFIIIGAGSAGCILAERLSAGGKYRVLLLEAGGSDLSPWLHIPLGYGHSFHNPRVNWCHETAPDPGLNGRRLYWPRGRVLGGSSAINAMVHIRGLPQDFDHWAGLGNPGWSWDEVLPWFRHLEQDERGPSAWHGSNGPLPVSDITARIHPLSHSFFAATDELGFARTPDFNGEHLEGIGVYPLTLRRGWRISSATAFLRPALTRPNLSVRLHARALRLLLPRQHASHARPRVYGLEYLQHGEKRTAYARHEVILSAGAVNSPQLLQLSGIGDPALLQHFGISMVRAAPMVGRNLQDHLAQTHYYRCQPRTLNNDLHSLGSRLKALGQYLTTRSGPLSLSVNQCGGFIRSDPQQTSPNLQLYFNALTYRLDPDKPRRILRPDPFSAFSMTVNACRPDSRGRISISSPDPLDAPIIEPGYLSTPHDRQEALAGHRILRRLAATRALQAIIEHEYLPGPAVQTDAQIMADLRARANTIYHPTGTCTMGPDPEQAVVDARLRVHGLQGLRVVDASVFPAITSGNINAPVMMVAEKGAALILEDAGQPPDA
ncbi:MAG: GMC family oxidoreductase N-terminal domain-containing protein [Thiothrix sp.]|nr:GMC family oxidoreductase N-terminal domain-containing protein [Thiothrix sp.]HPQ94192.1 GMC family oxidoreductase N-terminal domain-containing protein [Thiolinea sp.]